MLAGLMDIVHIASEFAPIAKVGGLGDVTYGLSKAVAKKGHHVRIFLPKYDSLDLSKIQDLKIIEKNFPVLESEKSYPTTFWSGRFDGLELVLIEPHHPRQYFNRKKIYGEEDDVDRFLFFCKAASLFLIRDPKKIDVIHLHDWLTAGCALFLKENCSAKLVLTIHNLQHQGKCARFNLDNLQLQYHAEDLRDPLDPENLNLLKGGILYSNLVTVVSPTYSREILTPEGGFGLETFLAKHKKKIHGILNGIDTDYWNPETDPFLVKTYSGEDPFIGKRINKQTLQKKLLLAPAEDKPLVASITRLVSQKGPDLIHYGIEKAAELGGQFALLGSTSDPEIQAQFAKLKMETESNPHIALHLGYDEALSHLLYASSDMFLMPSIFEPCGLSQMIAMRYGSIPLVHSVGGLKDTVFDPNHTDKPNGFCFHVPDNKGVSSVLERGFKLYQENPRQWQELIKNAMHTDFSWSASADKYIELYLTKAFLM